MMAANYMSSTETTNFARIFRLVKTVVPDLLRDLLITQLPVSELSAVLTTQKRKIFPVLMKHQKNILYPQCGVYQGSVKDLDTSLLYLLLRFVGHIPPHQNGWGNKPDIADRSLSANIDRLREQYNKVVAHAPNTSLSDGDFQARWGIIRQSVEEIQNSELNTGRFVVAVDAMYTMEMDHRMTNNYTGELLLDMKDKPMMAANYLSSKETTNFIRICRLVIDVIPDLFRDLLITRLPASGLSAVLITQKSKICSGLPPHIKKILYPGGGVYQGSVKDLDTSLLYFLLRNLGYIPPHQNGWGKVPGIADRSLSANMDRLREQRNVVFAHTPNASLSDGDFQASWDIIRQSVEEIQNSELNTGRFVVAVDAMNTMEMDHRMTNNYTGELLLDMKADMSTVMEDVSVLRETLDVAATDSRQVREGNDLPVEILQMDQKSIQLYLKCLEEKEEEDYRLRVIVIGQTEVGKTTLTRNLLRLPQIIPHTESTDGVDIHNSLVNLDDKDWITDADMQHPGKCLDARLIQSLQSIGSENTGADPNTEGDKSAQTASNSDEFDNDDQQNAGHARPIQSLDSTASKNTGADHDDLQNLEPSTPANEPLLKTVGNLLKGAKTDRDYTKLGELCVWDFAGQFVFYTTHHTFLTHRAVYLLVTRLDQNINDTVNNDQCFIDATGCKEMKIKDFVSYWMNSVHLYSGAAKHLAPVILVGTHLDKVENSSTKVEGSDEDSDDSTDSEVIINSQKKKKGGKTGSKKAKKSESSDSYAPKKKKQLCTKLLDAKLSESDDSDFQVSKKGKGKNRKAKTDSSEEQESTEEDSDAPTKKKGRGKRSAVSKQKEKGKKGKHSKRPRIKMASDSSDEKMSTEGEEEMKKEKKKKKKKKKGSSSEEDGSDEDEDGEGSPSKGRKKIRKIKSDKKLTDSTRKAIKAEQERQKRITEKQKQGDIEKKTKTYFEDLRRYLLDMESPTSSHLINTDYTVSNPPNELEIGNLRQKIVELASKQAYWGEKIPAKWITLEKALMEKKIEGVNIMSYDNVVELDKSTGVPIDDQDKIDLFLRFQHAKGNMIYFSEDCLRDYIVLNPQWLIDAFKCIITAQQFCTKNPALVKHWKALDKTGKLYLGMVDEIFRREDKFCRHKEHILGLMERLHIISHLLVDKDDDKSNTSEEFYFVPSLLKDKVTECEIENYVKGTNGTPYLCYVFENNFLPTAVFHRLIAACLSEYTVAKQESKFLIFCGCGIFDLNGGLTRLVVAFYDSVIQIGLFRLSEGGFAPETSTCLSVRQFVTETLERVLGRYDMNLPFTLNLKCEKSHHLSHEGLLSVDDVITGGKEVACHGHEKDNHTITRHSLLHLWFPDQVSATDSNQGEPAQPAPPAQSAYQAVPLEKYKMESDPRGLCLIINNKKYMTMDYRKGTDVDRDKLQKLFHQLNFKVVIKDDLPGMEMKLQLEELTRSEDLPRVDSLVICLLCHGDNGIVYGTDSVPLKLHDDAFKIFGPQSCPALKGKPKLFVVNSCRGEAGVVGTHSNTDSETDLSHDLPQNVPDAPSTTQSITPSLMDLYIAYSTFQGYLSYRSEENGSWFVSKLVEVFSEQASTVEIDHMMREVNKRVADMYDAKSLAVQIPAPTNTLTGQWYFNPVQLGETK